MVKMDVWFLSFVVFWRVPELAFMGKPNGTTGTVIFFGTPYSDMPKYSVYVSIEGH